MRRICVLLLGAMAALLLPATAIAQGATVQPRRDYGMCLNRVVQDKLADRLAADDFRAAARSACAAEETRFRSAWVAYEVGMRTARAQAEENANSQIDDYLQNAAETYREMQTPAAPR